MALSKKVKGYEEIKSRRSNGLPERYYCLKCRKPNSTCVQHDEFKFVYSSKLRVPADWKKRRVFRKFLDDCPIFANCVGVEQQDMFRDLLRDVKYFNKEINNLAWTNVKDDKKKLK